MTTAEGSLARPGDEIVSPEKMRQTLAGFTTGLSVVAAEIDGMIVGMAANSLVSVSLDPPLVSLSFAHSSTTWPLLRQASRWGISVLGEGQEQVLSDLRRPAESRFEGIHVKAIGQAAFIADSLATLEVRPRTTVEAGDHTLVILEVLALDRDNAREPLVFFGSRVHKLAS